MVWEWAEKKMMCAWTKTFVSLLGMALSLGALERGYSAPPNEKAPTPSVLTQKECSLSGQLETLRMGLLRGSPALKRFLRKQLRERAHAIPEAELRAAFEREREPAMIEELSGALSARMARLGEPEALRAPLSRAQTDRDPEARAATLRGLRGTGSVEAMAKLGGVDYAQFFRDPAPSVRQAVVQNLLSENSEVYFGHDRAVSEQAIAVARVAQMGPTPDPVLAARLLSQTSMETVSEDAVSDLLSLLAAADKPTLLSVRVALIAALGGVPSASSSRVISRLVDVYREDQNRDVRSAVVSSLVRLLGPNAFSQLETLRALDPNLSPEIDAWQKALRSGLQEWSLLLREKQRLLPETPKTH